MKSRAELCFFICEKKHWTTLEEIVSDTLVIFITSIVRRYMNKKLIIVGCHGTAELLLDIILRESSYTLVAATVESAYIDRKSFFDVPVVPIETIEQFFSPDEHRFFVGVDVNFLNQLRARLYSTMIGKGYSPISFISKSAHISPQTTIGQHCFFLENVVAHAGCSIGDNCTVFPNSYLGHHVHIGNNVFISSNVSIAGGVSIADNCFIGSNASITNSVTLQKNTVVGIGTTCTKSTKENTLIKSPSPLFFAGAYDSFCQWFNKIRLN